MGVKVEFGSVVEPLTPAADPTLTEVSWISSEAYSSLVNQFRRYCFGEVLGQSLLIAGHRGSGKTTLTHAAIQKVRWEADGKTPDQTPKGETTKKDGAKFSAVPFLVSLHGPDLFDCACNAPPSSETYERALAQHAMRQIMVALHRSFCEEISFRFSARLEGERLKELSAQLTMELDGMPALAKLREYWERARFLPHGVLKRVPEAPIGQLRLLPADGWEQGHRELMALDTCIHAARSIGMHTQPVKQAAVTLQSPDGFKLASIQLRDLLQAALPVLSLVAGGFSAFAVIEQLGPKLAGVVACITVAITYTFLRRTGDPSHERTLLPDATSASFDVLMPVLMQRLLQAGFAPIFVVDELDKVDKLATQMGGLMRRLKYFVTDRAIFCFLADRQFFEDFRAQIQAAAYPPQDTYFAEHFFVHFQPFEFHTYLGRILKPDNENSYKDVKDTCIVRYLLVFRSESHLSNLWRQISQETMEDQPKIRLGDHPAEEVLGYRLILFAQVAIEYCLESEQLQRRMRQDHNFTQWVLDALYYPVRSWRRGDRTLDTTTVAFRRYLAERVFPLGAGTGGRNGIGQRLSLDESDYEFLKEQLDLLLGYLTNPQQLVCALRDSISLIQRTARSNKVWPPPPCIQRIVAESPALLDGRQDTRRWNFTDYGRPTKESDWAERYSKAFTSGQKGAAQLRALFSRLILMNDLPQLPTGRLFGLLRQMANIDQATLGFFELHRDACGDVRNDWKDWICSADAPDLEGIIGGLDGAAENAAEEEARIVQLVRLRFTESVLQSFIAVVTHVILRCWLTAHAGNHLDLRAILEELRAGQVAWADKVQEPTIAKTPENLRKHPALTQRPIYSDEWIKTLGSFHYSLGVGTQPPPTAPSAG